MSLTSSELLEILYSIRHEWIYADVCIEKLQSGELKQADILKISSIIESSINEVSEEKYNIHIRNILFQLSLISLEEGEAREMDVNEANEIITRL